MSGLLKLVEILPQTKTERLECVPAPEVFAFLSAPIDTPPSLGSLAGNALCGVNVHGDGTYTTEGITKLCGALKGSTVTSLKCVIAPDCSPFCQRPLTCLSSRLCSHARSLEGNRLGPEGGAALAEGLKGNTTLQSLK